MIQNRRSIGRLLVSAAAFSVVAMISASPILTQPTPAAPQAILVPDDSASGAQFGVSVALEGNTLVVGSRYAAGRVPRAGAAYVYTRADAHAPWQPVARLTASDGSTNDEFGLSVALSGDTIIVGAQLHNQGTGAAYIFARRDGTWRQVARLAPNNLTPDARFGFAVAIAGDTALVGAYQASVGGQQTGSAYVFTRSSPATDQWTTQARLLASDRMSGDRFGIAVALDGSTALIGADRRPEGGLANAGAAYIFERVGTGWVQRTKLIATNNQSGRMFGFSVSLRDGIAVIGAPGSATSGRPGRVGRAHVYVRERPARWREVATLNAGNNIQRTLFGLSTALDGDFVLIGAPLESISNPQSGAAYVFQALPNGGYVRQSRLPLQERPADDQYGFNLALSGETLAIGIPFSDPGRRESAGSVALLSIPGRDADLTLTPEVIAPGASISVSLRDDDLNIDPTRRETHTLALVSSRGEREALTLRESAVNSGLFLGVMPTRAGDPPGADGDGVFVVADGDTITATYHDLRTSTGVPATLTRTVRVVDERRVAISVQAVAEDDTPREGDLIAITITATNDSPVDAVNLMIDAQLPSGLSFVETVGDGVYNPAEGVWSLAALPGRSGAGIVVTVSVDEQVARNLLVFHAILRSVTPPNSNTQDAQSQIVIVPRPRGEPNIGLPDGKFLGITCGEPPVIVSLGSNPIVTHPGYDFVYYEIPQDAAMTRVWLDFVRVEVGVHRHGPWYQVFNWGDQLLDANTSLGAVGIGANGEVNELVIQIGTPPFFGVPPRITGIAIDVDAVAPPGTYRFLRISVPPSGCRTAEVDSIQLLPPFGSVTGFTLVNTSTNADVRPLRDGDVINLNQLPAFTVRADTAPEQVGSVIFALNGQEVQRENVPPYALAGDTPPGNYFPYPFQPGVYTLTATPWSQFNQQGFAGEALTVTFEVVRR